MKKIISFIFLAFCVLLSQESRINRLAVNGAVSKIFTINNKILFLGYFDQVGDNVGRATGIDLKLNVINKNFPTFNNQVRTVIADGRGGFFVGGDFTEVGGVLHKRLIHLLNGGIIDKDWNIGIDGSVFSLTLNDTILYVSEVVGNTGTYYGQGKLRAINLNTRNFTDFYYDVDGPAHSLVAYKGILYIGGNFARIGGTTRLRLGAIDLKLNKFTAWDPRPGSTVRSISIKHDTIYITGDFPSLKGETYKRNGIAALPLDNDIPYPWNPKSSNNTVKSVVRGDSVVYISIANYGIVGTDVCTGIENGQFLKCNGYVNSMIIDSNYLYVAGKFDSIGNKYRTNIAKINLSDFTVSDWNASIAGEILSFEKSGNMMVVGGKISAVNTKKRTGLFIYDREKDSIINTQVNILSEGYLGAHSGFIENAYLDDSLLYFYGSFNELNGAKAKSFGVLNIYTNNSYSFILDTNFFFITDMIVSDSNLLICGSFTVNNRQTFELRMYDKHTGLRKALPINIYGASIIQKYGDYVYLTNTEFDSTKNINWFGRKIAKLNKTMDSVLWSIDVGSVSAMKITDQKIYIAGTFILQDSISFKRYCLETISQNGKNIEPRLQGYPNISSLEIMNNWLLIGGRWIPSDQKTFIQLEAVDINDFSNKKIWTLPGELDQIYDLHYNGKELLVGGDLSYFNNDFVGGFYLLKDNLLSVKNNYTNNTLPNYHALEQNYPNPFNPTTTISFELPEASNVNLVVYDYLGREVSTLVNEYKSIGRFDVTFNANNLASGVYFYKLKAGNFTSIKKMVLVK